MKKIIFFILIATFSLFLFSVSAEESDKIFTQKELDEKVSKLVDEKISKIKKHLWQSLQKKF